MTALETALLGGLALGLAGSLHCACMCGCIASGSLFILNPNGPSERLRVLLKLQAGRVLCYAAAGGIIAGTADLVVNPAVTAGSFRAVQWASAAIMIWLGFSMAGLVPNVALPGALSRLPASMDRFLSPAKRHPQILPFAMGITWGMTPCPMVYAALFSAVLTGSALGGVAWMAGFGIGTVPAVVATALGVSKISRIRSSQFLQAAAGLAIAAFASISVAGSWPNFAMLCGAR